jgi:hypothetical protein
MANILSVLRASFMTNIAVILLKQVQCLHTCSYMFSLGSCDGQAVRTSPDTTHSSGPWQFSCAGGQLILTRELFFCKVAYTRYDVAWFVE